MASSPTVAVVGLGALGLVTLKNLLEEGFDVTGYDQNAYVGGLWKYTAENKVSVLESTIVNISKERGCFTDFPFPDETNSYPTSAEVQDYLVAYADHFRLKPRMQLNSTVVKVERDDKRGKWCVLVRSKDGVEERKLFDKVAVATGANTKPKVPTLEGQELFKGRIIHSVEYKRPEDFKGQRCLIVGIANTAADTAISLAGVASKVWISHNRGATVLPRILPNGAALDHSLSYRKMSIQYTMNKYAPSLAQRFWDGMARGLQQKSFNIPDEWPISKSPSLIHHTPIISDDFIPALRSGDIVSVNLPAKIIGESTVELEGGETLEVDSIILCTGYYSDYSVVGEFDPLPHGSLGRPTVAPQEHEATKPSDLPIPKLYQNIFSLEHPESLAFIGAIFFTTSAFQLFDLASMAIAQLWKNPSLFPSSHEIEESVAKHRLWAESHAQRGGFNLRLVNAPEWMAWAEKVAGVGVSEQLGYWPSGWKFWLQDREFCNLVMDGIFSPHIYRLFEGRRKKWDGAREAIFKANESVRVQTGKRLKEMQSRDNQSHLG